MLEQMFFPRKVRRNRCCWLAADIERYLAWLLQQGFSEHLSRDRVPPLVRFGRFTRERGVSFCEQLPDHVDAFVAHEGRRCAARTREERKGRRRRARPAVEQMLRLSVPGFRGGRWLARPWPFAETAPGFRGYLRDERGLRDATIWAYAHYLRLLEAFLAEERLGLGDLTPASLTTFVVGRSGHVGSADLAACTGVLRVFLCSPAYAARRSAPTRCGAYSRGCAARLVSAYPRAVRLPGSTTYGTASRCRRCCTGTREASIPRTSSCSSRPSSVTRRSRRQRST